jgi:hypothetical protein
MNDRDQHIREIDYYLWEQEGCPEDQAERHWSAAVAVVEAQDAEARIWRRIREGPPSRSRPFPRLSKRHRLRRLLHAQELAKGRDRRPPARLVVGSGDARE